MPRTLSYPDAQPYLTYGGFRLETWKGLRSKTRAIDDIQVGRPLAEVNPDLSEFFDMLTSSEVPEFFGMPVTTQGDSKKASGNRDRLEVEDNLRTLLLTGSFVTAINCQLGNPMTRRTSHAPILIGLQVVPTLNLQPRLVKDRSSVLRAYGAADIHPLNHMVNLAQTPDAVRAGELCGHLGRMTAGIQIYATLGQAVRL